LILLRCLDCPVCQSGSNKQNLTRTGSLDSWEIRGQCSRAVLLQIGLLPNPARTGGNNATPPGRSPPRSGPSPSLPRDGCPIPPRQAAARPQRPSAALLRGDRKHSVTLARASCASPDASRASAGPRNRFRAFASNRRLLYANPTSEKLTAC